MLTPAIRTALEEVGVSPPPDEEIEASYGEPIPVICERLMPGGGERLHMRFLEALRRAQRETVRSGGESYPGVREMLSEVEDAGWGMAVCSNAGIEYIELVTEALAIRRFFKELSGISGEFDKAGRVREMARRAGGLSVVIGDRYMDIEAAAACGLPSIGCRWGYGGEGELEGATFSADSPAEVPGLLEAVRRGAVSGRSLYPPQR